MNRPSRVLALTIAGASLPLPCAGQRSPADLAVVEGAGWILTANEAAGSVSFLDIPTGRVLAEVHLAPGSRPRAIAARRLPDSRWRVAVSERALHRVALLDVAANPLEGGGHAPGLESAREVPVGRLPAGLLFSDRGALLVACSGEGEVREIDPASGATVRAMGAVEGAHLIAPHGASRVLVAGRTEVGEMDLESGRLLWSHAPAEGLALNLSGLLVEGDRAYVAHQVEPAGGAVGPTIIIWGLTLANRITVLSLPRLDARAAGGEPAGAVEWALPLDFQDRASGDPGAPALVPPRGGRPPALLVPSAGTGRCLRVEGLDEPRYPLARLSRLDRLPEVETPGRPLVARLSADGARAFVACWLDDAVLEVDVGALSVTRKMPLGPPPPETPEHQGARIFYDADRSLEGWYSCHSCHPDGATDGHSFDTAADGNGLPKRAPSLAGVDATGPWAWLGRFPSLREQVAASLESTMARSAKPAPEDVDRLIAFLTALRGPRPLGDGEDLGGDPGRGARLFREARCIRCHEPPYYTSGGLEDVGLRDDFTGDHRFNPPSLLGVRDRHRFLHDGRARSLEAIFREHDRQGLHGDGAALSEAELADLVAFLKTL